MMLVTEGEIVRQAHKGALVELHQIDDPTLSTGQVKLGVRRAESHSLNDMIGMRAFLMEQGCELPALDCMLACTCCGSWSAAISAPAPRKMDLKVVPPWRGSASERRQLLPRVVWPGRLRGYIACRRPPHPRRAHRRVTR